MYCAGQMYGPSFLMKQRSSGVTSRERSLGVTFAHDVVAILLLVAPIAIVQAVGGITAVIAFTNVTLSPHLATIAALQMTMCMLGTMFAILLACVCYREGATVLVFTASYQFFASMTGGIWPLELYSPAMRTVCINFPLAREVRAGRRILAAGSDLNDRVVQEGFISAFGYLTLYALLIYVVGKKYAL